MNPLVELISEITNVHAETVQSTLETPPDSKLGDVASTIAFTLAKKLRKNPKVIAEELIESLNERASQSPILDRLEAKGAYINIFFSRPKLANDVIDQVLELGSGYGKSRVFAGKRALVEFPAVNPSKPWHIGHTRNAVIGDTLCNILEAVGYDVLRIDYINDLGLQIAQLTWKLMKDDVNPNGQKYDHFLGHLYVDVQEKFETDPEVEREIREVSRKLEDLNSDESSVSREMVTNCVKAQCQTAYRLGIYHDVQVWESTIAHSGLLDKAKNLLLSCDSIVKLEEGEKAGCIVAKLDSLEEFKDMKDPYKVLFRSDGTRTYTGADVAFQMWKFGIIENPFLYEEFEEQPNGKPVYRTSLEGMKKDLGKFDAVFNIIGSAQAHPQKLIYIILDLLGYHKESENSHHIAYEFVGLEDESFSGRKGTWVGYSCDDVLERARELARKEVEMRNPDESDEFKDSVAESVGIGAVRYRLLNASPDRKITFRWHEVLDFNGDAGPYLQYSIARAKRILEKYSGEIGLDNVDLSLLTSDAEYELLKTIARFPDEVLGIVTGLKKEAWGTSFNSNRLTTYCYRLATLFNKFYDTIPILKADEPLLRARVHLVEAFRQTMENGLGLLGIPIVERM